MRNHFRGIPRKIYNFRRNRPRNLHEQICNRREQVVRAGCKLLRANCQSKYQHCGGSLQSCAEKNIRFDCNGQQAFLHVQEADRGLLKKINNNKKNQQISCGLIEDFVNFHPITMGVYKTKTEPVSCQERTLPSWSFLVTYV